MDLAKIVSHQIKISFVSTNSICQGESVPTFWKRMIEDGANLIHAYDSFVWNSEAKETANVMCVIISFVFGEFLGKKEIVTGSTRAVVKNINPYLIDAPNIWVSSRKNIPPVGHEKIIKGSEPTDGGALFLTHEEADKLKNKYPILEKYIRPFIGGQEFLNTKDGRFGRYCFWFLDANPADFTKIDEVRTRLEAVKQKRLQSSADRIRKRADYPYLFCQIRQPNSDYLVIPRHTSSNRKYIPFDFVDSNIIAGDAVQIITNVSKYDFGILTSNVHMAWMRVVAGKLGVGYRYSPLVYNNFPWPEVTKEQEEKISKTAQAILDARALYPDSSLADLYDELTMPPELRKAHQANDKAVMQAYGMTKEVDGKKTWLTESETVARLFEMYEELTK